MVHKIVSMARVKLIPIMEILEILLEFSLTWTGNRDLDQLCRLIKAYVVHTSLLHHDPEVIKLFYTQLSMKFIMLINVKMPTIVGILTFISMMNTTYGYILHMEACQQKKIIFSITAFHAQFS